MEDQNFSTRDLGELTVLNEQGEQVKLSSLWQKRTAALVFVRHFG
jgi:hypothetical protein